jgi:hypothetical protein
VHAVPKPPDAAFLVAVLGIAWGCLWRGALRWGGAALFACAIALYAAAPRPALLFDAELRAVVAREARGWTLASAYGRSTFARDRLGAMAGLDPVRMEKLPPPECDETVCFMRLPRGTRVAVVLSAEGFADPRLEGAVVLSRLSAPPGLGRRGTRLIDAADLGRQGGGLITELSTGLRIARARSNQSRPWSARRSAGDVESGH